MLHKDPDCSQSQKRRRQLAREMCIDMSISRCIDDPTLVGKSLAGKITDFSKRGLYVLTGSALVPDVLLNIRISIGDPGSSFELLGTVRKTKIIENYCHMAIDFIENESVDLGAWVFDFGNI